MIAARASKGLMDPVTLTATFENATGIVAGRIASVASIPADYTIAVAPAPCPFPTP